MEVEQMLSRGLVVVSRSTIFDDEERTTAYILGIETVAQLRRPILDRLGFRSLHPERLQEATTSCSEAATTPSPSSSPGNVLSCNDRFSTSDVGNPR